MGMSDIERRLLKGGTAIAAGAPAIEPIALRLADATAVSGFSRSKLYLLAAQEKVVFLKSGGRILVEFASLKAAIAQLPRTVPNIAAAQPRTDTS
jgi:hypothetical protein